MKQQWKEELKPPSVVKKLLQFMQRDLAFGDFPEEEEFGRKPRVKFIWTSRLKDGDCLVNPNLKDCPKFKERLEDLEPFGSSCSLHKLQEGGSSCAPPRQQWRRERNNLQSWSSIADLQRQLRRSLSRILLRS
jgi:hypothetical protein